MCGDMAQICHSLFLSKMNAHQDHVRTGQKSLAKKTSQRVVSRLSPSPCPKPGFVVPENIQLRIQLVKELRLHRTKAAKFSPSHIPKKFSLQEKRRNLPCSTITMIMVQVTREGAVQQECSTMDKGFVPKPSCNPKLMEMDKGFVPKPSCNPKLMEVPVEVEIEVEIELNDNELKEPVKPKNKEPHRPLDKYRGKPWFRQILKLDMECRIIELQISRHNKTCWTPPHLDPYKDKPWFGKVVEVFFIRLRKQLLMYTKELAILQAKP